MSTPQSEREIQYIVSVLTLQSMLGVLNNCASCANRATIGEIDRALNASGMSLARRTLQRRLASLVDAGTLQLEGEKRGARYTMRRDLLACLASPPRRSKTPGEREAGCRSPRCRGR